MTRPRWGDATRVPVPALGKTLLITLRGEPHDTTAQLPGLDTVLDVDRALVLLGYGPSTDPPHPRRAPHADLP